MKKHKICVVTGTRAEYGLLRPVIKRLADMPRVDLWIVATGTHLENRYGYTIDEILSYGFKIGAKIPCVIDMDDSFGMTLSTAKALEGFANYFKENKPDMLLLLGDRYEIFACATAAAMQQIPIAHMCGGDSTEGAVDEFFRHSITKMSYLHFVTNELSRKRVVQLGENPDRVFDAGHTGIENIDNMQLMSIDELSENLGMDLKKPYALVTLHPVTMEQESTKNYFMELIWAFNARSDLNYLFTKSNADAEGSLLNSLIDEFLAENHNSRAYFSLGSLRYMSAVKYAKMVIGNSSSGIYEVPALGIPTINIGNRQRGRLQPSSVINCVAQKDHILMAMKNAESEEMKKKLLKEDNPYRKPSTSKVIADKIIEVLDKGNINMAKTFYDL